MQDNGIVLGSAAQAKPLIIDVDSVYIHTNILCISNETELEPAIYQYNEILYEKDEYIQLIAEKNIELSTLVPQLEETMTGIEIDGYINEQVLQQLESSITDLEIVIAEINQKGTV